jgi:hypothetical protein
MSPGPQKEEPSHRCLLGKGTKDTRREIMKFQEMDESEKVEALVKIGVPVEVAEKASKGKATTKKIIVECTEAENLDKLVAAYQSMGLSEAESKVAARVEQKVITQDIDWSKFEF